MTMKNIKMHENIEQKTVTDIYSNLRHTFVP